MNQERVRLPHSLWRAAILVVVILGTFTLLSRSSAALGLEIARGQDNDELNTETDRIIQLADASQDQNLKCRRFLDHIRSIASDSEKKEYLVSKASAIALFKAADQYPGTPLATTQALDEFLSLSAYPSGKRLFDLQLALNRLGDCYSVEYYGVLTRLIDPRSRSFMTAAQIAQERLLLLQYIQHEAVSGPKFFSQFEKLVILFDRGIQEGLIVPHSESRIIIANLKWMLAKIKTENFGSFSKLEKSKSFLFSISNEDPKLPTEALNQLYWQLSQTEDLQDDLRDASELELEDPIEPMPQSQPKRHPIIASLTRRL